MPPPFPLPSSGITFREQFTLHRRKRRELRCPSYLWSFAFFSVQVLNLCTFPILIFLLFYDSTLGIIVILLILIFPIFSLWSSKVVVSCVVSFKGDSLSFFLKVKDSSRFFLKQRIVQVFLKKL